MDDLISRKAAIDALCDNCDNVQSVCPHYPCKRYTAIEELPSAQPERKKGEWTTHEVACLLAEAIGDDCACNVNGNDEWLPYVCEFAETTCPNVVGVTCWEQWLVHRKEKEDAEDEKR